MLDAAEAIVENKPGAVEMARTALEREALRVIQRDHDNTVSRINRVFGPELNSLFKLTEEDAEASAKQLVDDFMLNIDPSVEGDRFALALECSGPMREDIMHELYKTYCIIRGTWATGACRNFGAAAVEYLDKFQLPSGSCAFVTALLENVWQHHRAMGLSDALVKEGQTEAIAGMTKVLMHFVNKAREGAKAARETLEQQQKEAEEIQADIQRMLQETPEKKDILPFPKHDVHPMTGKPAIVHDGVLYPNGKIVEGAVMTVWDWGTDDKYGDTMLTYKIRQRLYNLPDDGMVVILKDGTDCLYAFHESEFTIQDESLE